jgi:hypothetical protein
MKEREGGESFVEAAMRKGAEVKDSILDETSKAKVWIFLAIDSHYLEAKRKRTNGTNQRYSKESTS